MTSKQTIFLTAVLALLLGGVSCNASSDFGDLGGKSDTDTDSDDDTDRRIDTDTSTSTDSVCGEVEIDFGMEKPTVVLLIDQSISMERSFGSSTRWLTVRDALLDPVDGVIINLEDTVRFSLQLYTSEDGFSTGPCPILTGTAPKFNAYSEIHKVFMGADPVEDTPTGESVDAIAAMLAADSHAGSKFIVLATDGEPDTCEVPDPESKEAMDMSVAAVEAAFDQGFKTYVISVGSDIGRAHLDDLAQAGQGKKDAKPYQALDQSQLVSAFDEIVYGVRSCKLMLEGKVQKSMVDQCVVTLDGRRLTYEDDWKLNNSSEVEIIDGSCDEIKHGANSIDVWCPCDAIKLK